MTAQGNSIAKAVLVNGVEVEVREIPGFGKKTELGIFISDQCMVAIAINNKGNTVDIRPQILSKSSKIKYQTQNSSPQEKTPPPSLSDVI
jgi:hypothetical protein